MSCHEHSFAASRILLRLSVREASAGGVQRAPASYGWWYTLWTTAGLSVIIFCIAHCSHKSNKSHQNLRYSHIEQFYICPDNFYLLSCQVTKKSRPLSDHVPPKIGGFGGLPYLGAFFLHYATFVYILCRIIDDELHVEVISFPRVRSQMHTYNI